MNRLKNANLIDSLCEHYKAGGFMLGICLGMQMLFDYGEEDGGSAGLGIIGGRVSRFSGEMKLPHMGYNTIVDPDSFLLTSGLQKPDFYFVHSYRVAEAVADETAHTEHGERFISAVRRQNCFGTQFHPEKSQSCGLYVINRFINQAFGN
jgi:imidazole glycerol phosphate synthase glutamine amidotransferase subunit